MDTAQVTNIIDGVAPTTTLTATPLVTGGSHYLVKWTVTNEDIFSILTKIDISCYNVRAYKRRP